MISCDCGCKHNKDGWCDKDWITISDEEMTSAGFYPICQDYEERGINDKQVDSMV